MMIVDAAWRPGSIIIASSRWNRRFRNPAALAAAERAKWAGSSIPLRCTAGNVLTSAGSVRLWRITAAFFLGGQVLSLRDSGPCVPRAPKS